MTQRHPPERAATLPRQPRVTIHGRTTLPQNESSSAYWYNSTLDYEDEVFPDQDDHQRPAGRKRIFTTGGTFQERSPPPPPPPPESMKKRPLSPDDLSFAHQHPNTNEGGHDSKRRRRGTNQNNSASSFFNQSGGGAEETTSNVRHADHHVQKGRPAPIRATEMDDEEESYPEFLNMNHHPSRYSTPPPTGDETTDEVVSPLTQYSLRPPAAEPRHQAMLDDHHQLETPRRLPIYQNERRAAVENDRNSFHWTQRKSPTGSSSHQDRPVPNHYPRNQSRGEPFPPTPQSESSFTAQPQESREGAKQNYERRREMPTSSYDRKVQQRQAQRQQIFVSDASTVLPRPQEEYSDTTSSRQTSQSEQRSRESMGPQTNQNAESEEDFVTVPPRPQEYAHPNSRKDYHREQEAASRYTRDDITVPPRPQNSYYANETGVQSRNFADGGTMGPPPPMMRPPKTGFRRYSSAAMPSAPHPQSRSQGDSSNSGTALPPTRSGRGSHMWENDAVSVLPQPQNTCLESSSTSRIQTGGGRRRVDVKQMADYSSNRAAVDQIPGQERKQWMSDTHYPDAEIHQGERKSAPFRQSFPERVSCAADKIHHRDGERRKRNGDSDSLPSYHSTGSASRRTFESSASSSATGPLVSIEKVDPSSGRTLETFSCITEAVQKTGISHHEFHRLQKGKDSMIDSFVWRLVESDRRFDNDHDRDSSHSSSQAGPPNIRPEHPMTLQLPNHYIQQLDPESGVIVAVFSSLQIAASSHGVDPARLEQCLLDDDGHTIQTCNGYAWRHAR